MLRRRAGELEIALLRPTVPEADVPDHSHEDMHLVLLLGGAYVSSARGMPEVCTVPALVFNPPGVEHRDRFRGRHGLFLTLSQPAAAFVATLGEARLLQATRLDALALDLGFQLLRASGQEGQDQPLVLQSLLAELLARVRPAPEPGADSPVLRRALDFLHSAPGTPDIGTLAAAAGVHPVYLARLFRKSLQRSPGEYLRRLRCLRALEWLARGRSAESAALHSGHVDASHLGRALRREFGLNPGSLRRAARG